MATNIQLTSTDGSCLSDSKLYHTWQIAISLLYQTRTCLCCQSSESLSLKSSGTPLGWIRAYFTLSCRYS
ncbi:hypothetical protein QN277_023609 [Acacia crassicarpa]|uniref:Uncharacterized protein n=1 Tax=Acacia crassicarpa TaxID=499986 RepID=A0AAE1MM69_9FABA|nr:hypothetical protein QN277_023609 [Acacia crassicarpa]